ncbi:MAG: type II secretion system protein [Candidatus Paceibacterota bacterium]
MFKKTDGFTLIELLVAVFILTVAISGVLSSFPLGAKIGNSSQLSSVASQLAQAKIEETISKSYDEIVIGEETEAYGSISVFPRYKRVTEVTCYDPNGSALSPNCPETGIKRVNVVLYWKSLLGAPEINLNITTLVVNK